MMNQRMLSLAMASAIALCGNARADSINVVLDNPTQTLAAGQTVTFTGTLSAPGTNTGTVYINGDQANSIGNGSVDTANDYDDPLLDNFFSLAPGGSQSGDVFTATIDSSAPDGSLTGDFIILGGSDPNASDPLSTLNFTVNIVNPATNVTPEPASWTLLASGLVWAAALGWRRFAKDVA